MKKSPKVAAKNNSVGEKWRAAEAVFSFLHTPNKNAQNRVGVLDFDKGPLSQAISQRSRLFEKHDRR
jgi:hypothetical protein